MPAVDIAAERRAPVSGLPAHNAQAILILAWSDAADRSRPSRERRRLAGMRAKRAKTQMPARRRRSQGRPRPVCRQRSLDSATGRYRVRDARAVGGAFLRMRVMKVLKSLKSAKKRHRDCRIVRRKGRLYVINKTNPRFKARQS